MYKKISLDADKACGPKVATDHAYVRTVQWGKVDYKRLKATDSGKNMYL